MDKQPINVPSTSNRKVFAFGELMLRLHAGGGRRISQAGYFDRYYGGSEANACVLLARLGIPAHFISVLPDNELGHIGTSELRSQGVQTGGIRYSGDRMGLYFTESGHGIRPGRVLYQRAGSSFSDIKPGQFDWVNLLEEGAVFHWSGISPAISAGAADCCAEALDTARQKGMILSSDFNYRSSLWNYGRKPSELMPELLQNIEVLVADLDAAAIYFRIQTDPDKALEDRFEDCGRQLQSRLPGLRILAMTFRRQSSRSGQYFGALMNPEGVYFSPRFELPGILDLIGAGDAFTAGLLYGVLEGLPGRQVIDTAVACGALKQSIPGDWALLNLADIDHFLNQGPGGRILR